MSWITYEAPSGITRKIDPSKVVAWEKEKSRNYGWFIRFSMIGGGEELTTGDYKFVEYVESVLEGGE